MKLTHLAAALAVTACSVFASTDSDASFYPPSYPMCSATDTVTTGPFELIKHTANPYSNHNSQLTVAYRGYLRNYYPDNEINFYVRLNGSDVFVPANAGTNNDAYAYFNAGPRDCAICSPPPYDYQNSSICTSYSFPAGGSGPVWVCNWPNATESELFYWAFNEAGYQNAWDIEVAAESHGYWDSNWGNNFYGRFEPRMSCY